MQSKIEEKASEAANYAVRAVTSPRSVPVVIVFIAALSISLLTIRLSIPLMSNEQIKMCCF